MKRDNVILMIALLCGLAAFGLIFNYLKQASNAGKQFVASSRALTRGTVLKAEDLVLSKPLKVPAKSYYTQIYDVVGKELQQDLAVGRLIPRDSVKERPRSPEAQPEARPAAAVETALPLPPLMKALNLSSQEIENMPRGVRTGDYVDILGATASGSTARSMRTVIHGASVIAVQKTDKDQVDSLTLALSSAHVELVLSTAKTGKLRLVKTSPAESKEAWSDLNAIEIIRGVQKETKAT